MTIPVRLPYEVLRNRYIRAHKALQAAVGRCVKLQERIDVLEAENKVLCAERELLKEERDASR